MESGATIIMKQNGTTYTVVMQSSENAKLSFEDIMKKVIVDAAMALETVENTESSVSGIINNAEPEKLSQS